MSSGNRNAWTRMGARHYHKHHGAGSGCVSLIIPAVTFGGCLFAAVVVIIALCGGG